MAVDPGVALGRGDAALAVDAFDTPKGAGGGGGAAEAVGDAAGDESLAAMDEVGSGGNGEADATEGAALGGAEITTVGEGAGTTEGAGSCPAWSAPEGQGRRTATAIPAATATPASAPRPTRAADPGALTAVAEVRVPGCPSGAVRARGSSRRGSPLWPAAAPSGALRDEGGAAAAGVEVSPGAGREGRSGRGAVLSPGSAPRPMTVPVRVVARASAVAIETPAAAAKEAASSGADWNRSSRSRERALAKNASRACGRAGSIAVALGTGASRIWAMTAPRTSPWKGSAPVTVWKRMTARDQMSLRASRSRSPRVCSGLM